MSTFLKKDLPVIVIAFVGFLIVLEWFLPIEALSEIKSFLGLVTTIIGNVSFGIGTVYAITGELNMIKRNRNWRQYLVSGSMFAMLFTMIVIIILYGGLHAPFEAPYKWYQYNIYQPQSEAMYAVMFLYQCSALYRVCRARSMETTILIVVGGAFIFANIPLFASFVPGVSELGDFVVQGPSLGGTRPANITGAIGAMIVGLRSLIGKEQTTIEVN